MTPPGSPKRLRYEAPFVSLYSDLHPIHRSESELTKDTPIAHNGQAMGKVRVSYGVRLNSGEKIDRAITGLDRTNMTTCTMRRNIATIDIRKPGARPTNGISIEFEIRSKFGVL